MKSVHPLGTIVLEQNCVRQGVAHGLCRHKEIEVVGSGCCDARWGAGQRFALLDTCTSRPTSVVTLLFAYRRPLHLLFLFLFIQELMMYGRHGVALRV
jgi:hypothetical protein